jgi:hypothetical protein
VSIVNGTGFNLPDNDNNDAKDMVVRMRVTPPALGGLTVIASGAPAFSPTDSERVSAWALNQYDVPWFRVGVEGLRQSLDHERAGHGVVGYAARRKGLGRLCCASRGCGSG